MLEALRVFALDEDFQTVTVDIPYTNLQWTRKYYEAGEFSMQVTLDVYDQSWAYIGSTDRPELGMVQKVEHQDETERFVQVSGFFCEKMLDDRVCFPRYTGDASYTETAAHNIFKRYLGGLPIEEGQVHSPLLGDRTQSDFSDDELGTKLYSILETRELSQRVEYDYLQNKLVWSVWHGVDRTQSQSENPWAVFSSEFGNIDKSDYTRDSSDLKNYCIIPAKEDENGKETVVEYVDWTNGGDRHEMVLDKRGEKPEDGQSDADFRAGLRQEGAEAMMGHQVVEDVDIDSHDGQYLVDYDLGDVCDIIIQSIGVTAEARIVEVDEVYKAGSHKATLGFGNKRISNTTRRANR